MGTGMEGVQADGPGARDPVTELLEAVGDGVASLSAGGMIEAVNPPFAATVGWDRAALVGRALADVLPGLEATGGGIVTTVARRADRAEHAVEAHLLSSGRTLVVRPLADEPRGAEDPRPLRDVDPLTGLLTRRRFEIEAERELSRAERYGGGAMVVLGVDDFSHLNDELGHQVGDELLRETGELVRERLREIDLCGRLGSDQFGVLLTEVTPSRARQIGDDILGIIHGHRFELEDRSVAVRVSGGVVGLDTNPNDVSEAMSWAELAMRRAKAMGGGRIFCFEDGLRADVDSARTWRERIRRALDSDAFVPHFQPILDLSTDEIASWELLIRMRGERGELIPPIAFLPTAERYGLIHELDRWVVRSAIAAMRMHRDRPEINLEINLSGKSIGNAEMLETIRTEIDEAGIDPARVIFEVTETSAIGNLEEASRFGEQLRELGCGFALDDFGTGFASFYYLKRLPLTHLKIDGDFIRGITSSEVDQLVVRAIVEIAHGMGLRTIAEYVEDAPTLDLLRELEVDYCQGFEVGRPTPPVPPDRLPETA